MMAKSMHSWLLWHGGNVYREKGASGAWKYCPLEDEKPLKEKIARWDPQDPFDETFDGVEYAFEQAGSHHEVFREHWMRHFDRGRNGNDFDLDDIPPYYFWLLRLFGADSDITAAKILAATIREAVDNLEG